METPGDRLVKLLRQKVREFSKTKFAIPAIIALSCLVYYAVATTITVVCFSNLIAPLFMLALLWSSGVRRVRRLLLIGVIATLCFAVVLTGVIVSQLQHLDPVVAESVDKRITGTLDQYYVDKGENFTFHLTVNVTDANATVNSANLRIIGIGAFDSSDDNLSMNWVSTVPHYPDDDPNHTNPDYILHSYSRNASSSLPVNQFIFKVNVNGTWMAAGDVDAANNIYYIQGPILNDTYALTGVVALSALQIDFFYVFGPYAIILGMIWWTRRARRMREKQIEKLQAEQAKEDAKKPKSGSKVPSLDAAMGKVDEGFVCSECGADVPADAAVCPKCGEKFE